MRRRTGAGFLQEYGGLWVTWGILGALLLRKWWPKCCEGEGVAHGCLARSPKPGSVLEEGGQQLPRTAPTFACCPHPPVTQAVRSAGSLRARSSLWEASSPEGSQGAKHHPSSPGRYCSTPVSGKQLRSLGGTPVTAPTAGKELG